MLPTCRPDGDDSAQGFLSYLLLYFFQYSAPFVTQPSLHVTSEVYHTVIPTAVPMNKMMKLGGNTENYIGWKSVITWGTCESVLIQEFYIYGFGSVTALSQSLLAWLAKSDCKSYLKRILHVGISVGRHRVNASTNTPLSVLQQPLVGSSLNTPHLVSLRVSHSTPLLTCLLLAYTSALLLTWPSFLRTLTPPLTRTFLTSIWFISSAA